MTPTRRKTAPKEKKHVRSRMGRKVSQSLVRMKRLQ